MGTETLHRNQALHDISVLGYVLLAVVMGVLAAVVVLRKQEPDHESELVAMDDSMSAVEKATAAPVVSKKVVEKKAIPLPEEAMLEGLVKMAKDEDEALATAQ